MHTLYWILVFLGTYFFMEFMAWFTHKYIMHGLLWSLHKDHHHKDHDSWFERNDSFFIFYAIDKKHPTIESHQFLFFLNYAIAALFINYFLLPRFFYKNKYWQFGLGLLFPD